MQWLAQFRVMRLSLGRFVLKRGHFIFLTIQFVNGERLVDSSAPKLVRTEGLSPGRE